MEQSQQIQVTFLDGFFFFSPVSLSLLVVLLSFLLSSSFLESRVSSFSLYCTLFGMIVFLVHCPVIRRSTAAVYDAGPHLPKNRLRSGLMPGRFHCRCHWPLTASARADSTCLYCTYCTVLYGTALLCSRQDQGLGEETADVHTCCMACQE